MSYKQLMFIVFITNGIALIAIKVIGENHSLNATNVFLMSLYGTASVITLINMLTNRKTMEWRSIAIGSLAGVCSLMGMFCLVKASSMIPGYIVFPLANGGSLLLVALVGFIIFKEKIGPYGMAGIISGILAIILLKG